MHSPDAISFDTTINIANPYGGESMRNRQLRGCYGSIDMWRDDLTKLRNGETTQVQFELEGLELHIENNNSGPRPGLWVQGASSSHPALQLWNGATSVLDIGDCLIEGDMSGFCLRFAFQSSLVDPPHIDNLIHDIDELLSHLRQFAPASNGDLNSTQNCFGNISDGDT